MLPKIVAERSRQTPEEAEKMGPSESSSSFALHKEKSIYFGLLIQ
jgi:hypothetical protein